MGPARTTQKERAQICIVLDAQQCDFHHPFQDLHVHFFIAYKDFQVITQEAIIHPIKPKCFISCWDSKLHPLATYDLQQNNPKAVDIGLLSYQRRFLPLRCYVTACSFSPRKGPCLISH